MNNSVNNKNNSNGIQKKLNYGYDIVYNATLKALKQNKLEIISKNRELGMINAKYSGAFWPTAKIINMMIQLEKQGKNTTISISSESSVLFGLASFSQSDLSSKILIAIFEILKSNSK